MSEEEEVAAPGYTDRKDLMQRRLRRIEGQVRGLQNMILEDRYCIEVLDQISATTRALQAVALELLDDHISHCVVTAVKRGGAEKDAKIAEATAAIARLVKS
jgi:DNA-binding FrmR family transcriptional regulator